MTKMPRGWARAAGRALMPDLIAQGLSSAQALRQLKNIGFSYRRQVMLEDFNKFSGLIKHEKYWKAYSRTAKPNLNMLPETDLHYPANYRHYFTAKVKNAWTDEIEDVTLSGFYDGFTTIAEIEEKFLESYSESYGDLVSEWISFKFKAVEHNKGFGY